MTGPGGSTPPGPSKAAGLAREAGIPALAGAACVLGFAPVYAWPVPIVALAAAFHAWCRAPTAARAALSGFAFGLGLFLAGVSWVYVSLSVYGGMHPLLAALATLFFCAYLAAFPALAAWLSFRLFPAAELHRMAILAPAFVAFEWARGWLFTGFPWLALGTSQVPSSPLAGFAPVLGGYGVSLAAAAAAALLAALAMQGPGSRLRSRLLAGLAILFVAGGLLRMVPWTAPAGAAVTVALLQGNVDQHLKFRAEHRERILADYLRMTVQAKAGIVVLPETALPALLEHLPPGYLDALRDHARSSGKEILVGAIERRLAGGETQYYNSIVHLGDGAMRSYRKRHLVPFGEFTPPGFPWILKLLNIPFNDLSPGEARQPALRAAGIALGVAICYEDVFGEEVIDHLPGAGLLLNVSNDAWYGRSLAADQHLQSSQVRALETGRWMLRATNTGVTAAIDPEGRVVSRLPQFTVATLVESVVPRAGLTPYARWGNAPALALVAGLVAATLFAFRKRP